jgi:hypothetical protein
MYKRMTARLLFLSFLIVLSGSCAKISSPSGGLRDRIPPVVVKSVPLNGAKNFKGSRIEIMFDEYVVLDNITEKFMVSPPMKKKPRVLIRGKAVVIEFEEKLKDSTTYTFNFLDAIKDLNEGNILQNYQFVVATGQVIDSLSVTGNIYKANNLEVPEKTIALLYRELADSAVEKHLPEYISRVDPTGYFRINNIRPGTYRLFGLKDGDNSKNYNLPDEDFAFMDSTISITAEKNYIPPPPVVKDTVIIKKKAVKNGAVIKDSTSTNKGVVKVAEPVLLKGEYRLFQFAAQKKAHYLTTSKRDQNHHMLFVLSLPPDSMKFEFSIPDADSKSYFTEPSRNRDTLNVWLSDSSLYSRREIRPILKYPFTDSLGITGYKQDTIPMLFAVPKPGRVPKVKKPVLGIETNILTGSLKPGQTIVFKSKTPFREPDTSKIKLYETALTTKQKVPYELVRDSLNSGKYYLNTKLVQGKKYLFVANTGSFSDIYNVSTDSVGVKFSIKDPDTYCKLTLDIKNYEGGRIIQLLDKSEKLLGERYMTKDGKTAFPLLETGTYRVRVIYDKNGDGKWTTGDFSKHRQPEPVSYYPKELELRSGFEVEQSWDIGVKNFKDAKMVEIKKGKQ